MAAKGIFFAVLVCAFAFAQASTPAKTSKEARFFSADDTSITIGTESIFTLIILAVVVGIIGVVLGIFSGDKTDLTGYAAPTAYAASAPAYTAPAQVYGHHEESAYNVHRSIEDAHTKYQ